MTTDAVMTGIAVGGLISGLVVVIVWAAGRVAGWCDECMPGLVDLEPAAAPAAGSGRWWRLEDTGDSSGGWTFCARTVPADPVLSDPAPALDPLIEQARQTIEAYRRSVHAYKQWAEQLQERLDATRIEVEDWQAAAAYHAETVRVLRVDLAAVQEQALRTQQENAVLRLAYTVRTQDALRANYQRYVLRQAEE